jgi:catechol 2,3-dioxygenase
MTIHPEVRIGHVHLTVSNLERSLRFYRDALGFQVTQRYGQSAVFLSAGGYHHHIALNTWAGEGATQSPPGRTGLYHFAFYIQRASNSPLLSNAYSITASRSMARPIMA